MNASEICKLVTLTVLVLFAGKYYMSKGSSTFQLASSDGVLCNDCDSSEQCGKETVLNLSYSDLSAMYAGIRKSRPIIDKADVSKLRSVIIFARHGDRAPSVAVEKEIAFWRSQIPNYEDTKYAIPERILARANSSKPFGWLSKKGVCEMQELGKWLRDTYNELLKRDDTKPRFYSTDYERTARSASVVASEINAGFVNVQSSPRRNDPLDPWESLSDFPEAVTRFEQSNADFLRLVDESEHPKIRLLEAMQGQYFSNPDTFDWISAYDLFVSAEAHPNPQRLLDSLLSSFKQEVFEITLAQFVCLYEDAAIRKLAVGGLSGGLVQWLSSTNKKNTTVNVKSSNVTIPWMHFDEDSKFVFVACHDVNLLPLKIALKWEPHGSITWPEYGYFIAIEIYEDYIRAFDSKGKYRDYSSMSEFARICLE